jgi:hypothetical protein
MSQKPMSPKAAAERAVKDIRRATRKRHSTEEKITIVLAGLRGEDSSRSSAGARASRRARSAGSSVRGPRRSGSGDSGARPRSGR